MTEEVVASSVGTDDVGEENLRQGLDRVALQGFRTLTAGIAFIYAVFTVTNLVVDILPEYAFGPVVVMDVTMLAVSLSMWVLIVLGRVPTGFANPLGAVLAALLVLNILATMRILEVPYHTIYVTIVITGAGCFLLSTAWMVAVIVGCATAWAVAMRPYASAAEFAYYALSIFAASVIAYIVHRARLESHTRVWEMRQVDARNRQHLARTLKHTENLYKQMVETAYEGIGIIDPEGRISFVNPRVAEMLAYPADELVGMRFLDIVHRDDRGAVEQRLRERVRIGAEQYECRFLGGGGSVVWMLVTASPLRDGSGRFVGSLGLLTDITERKRSQDVIRQSEQHYRGVFDGAFDSILVFDPESEVILDVNRHACETYGYERDELVGTALTTIAADAEQERAFVRQTRERAGHYRFETVHVTRQGRELLLDVNASVVDYDGQPAILSINREVTERRMLEKEIRDQHDLLRTALNALSHPFFVVDATTYEVLLANDAACRGRDAGDHFCYALTYGKDRPCSESGLECPVKTVCETGMPAIVEHVHATAEGEQRIFEVHGYPVFDEMGEVTRVIEHNIEVTRDRRVQEQVQAQERLAAVGQLAAGIAHDFNNILQMIQMYAEFLRQNPRIAMDDLEQVNAIISQTSRAANLVRQILDFSRKTVRAGRPLDLSRAVSECVQLLRRTIREKILLSLEIEDAGEDHVVKGDFAQIQQIITNLVLNAQDAMPGGGEVVLSLRCVDRIEVPEAAMPPEFDGEWVELRVSDTGEGIPHELQAKVFEPFFTTKGPHHGTGLGLAQVYGIVKQHDGYIGLESHPGRGTVFKVWLPRIRAEEEDSDSGVHPVVTRGDGELVVVVEDEQPLLHIVERSLNALGYRVKAEGDPRRAITLCEELGEAVDLVLSDVVMPGFSGPELMAAVRPVCPRARFILMSGYPLEDRSPGLSSSEEFFWLQKPFSIRKLMEAVNLALTVDSGP